MKLCVIQNDRILILILRALEIGILRCLEQQNYCSEVSRTIKLLFWVPWELNFCMHQNSNQNRVILDDAELQILLASEF